LTITQTDALAVHQTLLENQPELIGADVRRRLAAGRNHSGLDYASSMQQIWLWRNRVQALFQSNDLLLVPTTPCVAPPIADVEKSKDFRMGGLTLPWSAAGTPALSVPGGFTPSGLPAGIQLVAAPWREAILFRAGVAYQAATDWHQRRPSLPMTRN
jgi:aspartyl-tRNA(Asn)/glutamyl-tRNA(Gln) amidotransferase subunit A